MVNPYLKQKKPSKEEIVIRHADMVKHVANRLAARLPPDFQRDDLIQAGMIGLLEAADKYDPSTGNKFKTYAEVRVRGAMLDELRKRDWIPRSVRDNAGKLEKAYTKLRAAKVDNPTDKQLANELGIKPKEMPEFLNKARPIPLLSVDSMGATDSDGDTMNVMETISDPDVKDPSETLLGEEAQELVAKSLQRLPEKEKLVLALYYNEELNLKEIGAVLDVSESRVSQMRTKAIAMLRSYMKEYVEA